MKCTLKLEAFEERVVPATYGIPWLDSDHVTLSFAPDNTVVNPSIGIPFSSSPVPATVTSNLSATLAGDGLSSSQWQGEILRAFKTWAAAANIGLTVVADNGAAEGAIGKLQGDPQFGDIRIFARPFAGNALAITAPPGYTTGTEAGDLILNSNYAFGIGGGNGTYDLFTTVLHEAGHSFGFPDETTDPTSVMYSVYSGVRVGLAPVDVAAIQSLYGPPSKVIPTSSPLAVGATAAPPILSAGSTASARVLTPIAGTTAQTFYQLYGQLSGEGDQDYFSVATPNIAAGSTTDAIVVLEVVNSDGTVVGIPPHADFYSASGQALPSVPLMSIGNQRVYQVTNLPGNSTLFVDVNRNGGFTSDAYRMEAVFQPVALGSNSTTIASGTVSSATPDILTLNSNAVQQFAFTLTVNSGSLALVSYQVYDSNHNLVVSGLALSGTSVSSTASLLPGKYTIKVALVFGIGTPPTFRLGAANLTDPIDVGLSDALSPDGNATPEPVDWTISFDPWDYIWLM